MQSIDNVIQEIKRVELTIFNVRKELKTLKRRVAGYKKKNSIKMAMTKF